MKTIAYIALAVGVVSLVIGIISRVTMSPIALGPGGQLTAESFLSLANTCLLLSIALSLLETAKK